jgi:integrase
MPRLANKLTALTVKNAKANGKPRKLCDGNGLYLQLTPSRVAGNADSKVWVFRYRSAFDKKDHNIGLGSYPDVDLARAREKAQEQRDLIDKHGIDPLQQKKEEEETAQNTFAKVAEACWNAKKSGWRTQHYRDQWIASLRTYALPIIGNIPIDKIKQEHVLQVLTQETTKTRGIESDVAYGTKGSFWEIKNVLANHVRERIEVVIGYAMTKGLYPNERINPATFKNYLQNVLPKKRDDSKITHHEAMDYSKISTFMRRLRARKDMSARAIEFAILTVSRTKNVRLAVWGEIDWKERVWKVPGSKMKKARSHSHDVPLSSAAVALLEWVRPESYEPDDLIFPSPIKDEFGKRQVYRSTALLAYLHHMFDDMKGRKPSVHGMRSTFTDWAGDETEYPEELAKIAKAHYKGGTHAAYRRKAAIERRRALMQDWCAYLGT